MDNLGEDLNDSKNNLCLIKSGKTKGFGFFLEFKEKFFPINKSLITSISILDPNDIKNKKEIVLDCDGSEKILKINDNRKIFSDNNLGYICIEIIDEDEIDDFMFPEDNMLNPEKESLVSKEIYIPKYQNNTISFSTGKIITDEKNKLEHDCDIKEDSLGAPIFYGDDSFYAIGLQKGYDANNKNHIATPISGIARNIMYQKSPLIFNEECDFESLNSLSDGALEFFNILNKVNENSFLDIMSKKFNRSIISLASGFASHLAKIEVYDNYAKELINYYSAKTKIIFDTNEDDDSIINFMSKVYGKSNLACFYDFSFSGESDEEDEASGGKKIMVVNSKNFAFLNGKFEFINNNFDFNQNNIFLFGNYAQMEDDEYEYESFEKQNSSLLTKIKDNSIYALFYRDSKDIRLALKIENNFMKNKILITQDYDFYESLKEEFEEKGNFEAIDEKFDNLDDSKKIEVNFKELIIYEIDN